MAERARVEEIRCAHESAGSHASLGGCIPASGRRAPSSFEAELFSSGYCSSQLVKVF